MAKIKLTEMESKLYETVDTYRKTVDRLVENVNNRNEDRVEEIRRGIRNSAARKQVFSLAILAGGTVAAFIFYKILGVF
ncbi:MAG: hypothetical protein IJI24_02030 [Lachnospiraceae bacterium]|nr:hypothetical protein [Lachnospiraceae bacterium]